MDELTDPQIEELRVDLQALLASLKEALAANAHSSDVVDLDAPIGRISRIDAIAMQQMAEANKARNQVRIRQVEAALAAIRSDLYGECKGCEEDIGYKRLKARPETPFCLGCQRHFETARKR